MADFFTSIVAGIEIKIISLFKYSVLSLISSDSFRVEYINRSTD